MTEKKSRTLLIGNGIHRIGNQLVSWDAVLKYAAERIENETGLNVDLDKMDIVPGPTRFELLMNIYNQKKNASYEEVKTWITDYLEEFISEIHPEIYDSFSDFVLRYSDIITTNYDTRIEDMLLKKKGTSVRYSISGEVKKDRKPYRYLFTRTNKLRFFNQISIYHMHGIYSNPASICLGYEHYAGVVSKLRDKLSKKEDNSNNEPYIVKYLKGKLKKEEKEVLENEYETRFFDQDMDIVALSLNADEIDIWWLLIYRAYLYYSDFYGARKLIDNQITYYDLVLKNDDTSKKKHMFENMHVRYVPIVACSYKENELIRVYNEFFGESDNV